MASYNTFQVLKPIIKDTYSGKKKVKKDKK